MITWAPYKPTTPIELLAESLGKLNERDRTFADSLVQQASRGPLSPKQRYWVDTLLERATATKPVAPQVTTSEGVKEIVALINRNNNAMYPSIRFIAGDLHLKLKRAGERARYPGTLNVVGVTNWESGESDYYGRIHLDGRFEPSQWIAQRGPAIIAALRSLAEDPEKAAREYGKKMGVCCFCGLPLDDERSLLQGYGPVCARNYQLAWGDRPEEMTS